MTVQSAVARPTMVRPQAEHDDLFDALQAMVEGSMDDWGYDWGMVWA